MMQHTAAAPPRETEVVFGIPIADPTVAQLTRKVMRIASAMSLFALLSFILAAVVGAYYSFGIVVAVAIPCCGYFGAKKRDRSLLRWFWVCNALCVAIFFISAIIVFAVLFPSIDCLCDTKCRNDNYDNNDLPDNWNDICNNKGSFKNTYYASFGIGLVMAALQIAGAVYGKRLAKSQYYTESHIPTAHPVYSAHPTHIQPSYAQTSSYPPQSTAYDAPGMPYQYQNTAVGQQNVASQPQYPQQYAHEPARCNV